MLSLWSQILAQLCCNGKLVKQTNEIKRYMIYTRYLHWKPDRGSFPQEWLEYNLANTPPPPTSQSSSSRWWLSMESLNILSCQSLKEGEEEGKTNKQTKRQTIAVCLYPVHFMCKQFLQQALTPENACKNYQYILTECDEFLNCSCERSPKGREKIKSYIHTASCLHTWFKKVCSCLQTVPAWFLDKRFFLTILVIRHEICHWGEHQYTMDYNNDDKSKNWYNSLLLGGVWEWGDG